MRIAKARRSRLPCAADDPKPFLPLPAMEGRKNRPGTSNFLLDEVVVRNASSQNQFGMYTYASLVAVVRQRSNGSLYACRNFAGLGRGQGCCHRN